MEREALVTLVRETLKTIVKEQKGQRRGIKLKRIIKLSGIPDTPRYRRELKEILHNLGLEIEKGGHRCIYIIHKSHPIWREALCS